MIKIHYVPPSAGAIPQEELPQATQWLQDERLVRPFDGERIEITRGKRSKLALDGVGHGSRRRRNQRDTLALSKEWQALAGQAGGGAWQGLHDATTALDPAGQPNLDALRQAQRQLRQWFFQRTQAQAMTPALQAQSAKVDELLERLIRRALLGAAAKPAGKAVPSKRGAGEGRMQAVLDLIRPGARNASSLHRKGLRLIEANQPEPALDALEAAAAKAPRSARIHLDLGRLLTDEGHYAEAEWTLLTADELAPKRTGPQIALGELYSEMGQPQMALEAFKTAVARNPNDTDAQALLGVAYYEQGDLAAATPHLQHAVSLDQQCVVARFYLAQISLQENDLLRARFQLGMVAKLSPDMDLSRFNQAQPQAIAATGTAKTAPLHHWQLPTRLGTTALDRTGTGPLEQPRTSTLVEKVQPGG